MTLTFDTFDLIMKDVNVPKDISKLIYSFYKNVKCQECMKGCDNCDFCVNQRKGQYYCQCCCICDVVWNENWKFWFHTHSGIEIEDEIKEENEEETHLLSFDALNLNVDLRPITPPSSPRLLNLDWYQQMLNDN